MTEESVESAEYVPKTSTQKYAHDALQEINPNWSFGQSAEQGIANEKWCGQDFSKSQTKDWKAISKY